MSEQELITQLRMGEESAFRELVSLFQDKVFNTAIGFLQSRQDAEDIAQEVFVTVYEKIHQFKGDSSLSTWIYRITLRHSLNFLRKQKRQKRFAFVQSLFTGQGLEPASELPFFHHPGVLLENTERAAVLFKAIEKLPDSQKAAFVLHKLEDLSYAEIAVVLQTTVPAVESLLSRAKQNLKKLLTAYYEKNEK